MNILLSLHGKLLLLSQKRRDIEKHYCKKITYAKPMLNLKELNLYYSSQLFYHAQ